MKGSADALWTAPQNDASPPKELVSVLKRPFEQMIESDFALYGKTAGILQLEPAATIVCGVVCGGWPSWAMGAKARGFNVKYIITKTNVWTNYIKGWFPKADIIEYTDSFDWQLLESNVNLW